MTYTYKTKGTCAGAIEIELNDDNIIENVRFIGGCKGNTQGISALVKGMKAEDVINRVSGIRCGFKPTSCPDQLSVALKQMLEEK
ncbi:MAG: TIGR03905 family TSCPD domain-containing protein [Clostridia bacterium]|nr:TIGR03905 family TSCPD domain-containing protein [Clostridia bacterium]